MLLLLKYLLYFTKQFILLIILIVKFFKRFFSSNNNNHIIIGLSRFLLTIKKKFMIFVKNYIVAKLYNVFKYNAEGCYLQVLTQILCFSFKKFLVYNHKKFFENNSAKVIMRRDEAWSSTTFRFKLGKNKLIQVLHSKKYMSQWNVQ